jgi:preprotein translocase subunit SecG
MLITLLYLVFVLSALLLILVVLIQEGKGGGLGDAFGGAGQQTFGVGASGITKFTSYVSAVFLLTAVLITVLSKREAGSILNDTGPLPTGGSSALGAGPNDVAPPAGGGNGGAPTGGSTPPSDPR